MSRRRKNSEQVPRQEPRRYEIVLTRAAERGLSGLSKADLLRVDAKIQSLRDDPRPTGAKELEGVPDRYRVRSGNYRILYQIEDARLVIVVVNVGDRRDIYRSL
jgi:mRNA interferase RelE/StbE